MGRLERPGSAARLSEDRGAQAVALLPSAQRKFSFGRSFRAALASLTMPVR